MLEIGTYLAERYEIVGKVGAGGMADVYKAKDNVLNRFVAVKVLKPEFSEDRNFVTKFRTEAQSAAGLEHPNIVNIYDVGSEDGVHYIVMEYVEGITLKTYVEKKGQLTFKEAISIAIQVARGIESAHNKHLIHRDIKPQNIIISTEGKVKVTDFGIARAASSNTISADVMGSVHYASPEQARNGFVDGRSDIYSLGIVMYEMITGRVPFDGDTTVAVALQHLQEEMTPPSAYAPNLPISMEKIIAKCTQKNPDRRYQGIGELLTDLRKALITPDEDFVVLAPLVDNGKTKVISEDELEQIRDGRGIVVSAEEPELEEEPIAEEEEQEESEDLGDLDGRLELTDFDEDDEVDNKAINPKLDKAMNIMMAIAGVVIVIVIIYFILSIAGVFSSDPNKNSENQPVTESVAQVPMIDILGDTQEDAEDKLEEIGLSLNVVETRESDTQKEGTILEQHTKEGTLVPQGTVIDVVVVKNEEKEKIVKVPKVLDCTEQEAKTQLEEAGLVCDFSYEESEEVEAGYVISQEPSNGTTVEDGSTVRVVVSTGQKPAEVPSLVGKEQAAAIALLEEAGLKAEVEEEFNSSYPAGQVTGQSPTYGKTVQAGSTVKITVSKGTEVVYYECNYPITDMPEGTYAVDASIKGMDGSIIWSRANNPISADSTGFNVQKSNIVGNDKGIITITFYYETTVQQPDTVDEEGNTIPGEVVTERHQSTNTYPVEFTKQDGFAETTN